MKRSPDDARNFLTSNCEGGVLCERDAAARRSGRLRSLPRPLRPVLLDVPRRLRRARDQARASRRRRRHARLRPALRRRRVDLLPVDQPQQGVGRDRLQARARRATLARRSPPAPTCCSRTSAPARSTRLGLDYDALRAHNPRLIYCSHLRLRPHRRPRWVRRPGYDLAIQGMGGLASLTGDADGPPLKVGIVDRRPRRRAVRARRHPGRAARARAHRPRPARRRLDARRADLAAHLPRRQPLRDRRACRRAAATSTRRSSPYETFRAADGFVNIAVGNDAQWRALCARGRRAARRAARPTRASPPTPPASSTATRSRAILEPLVAARPSPTGSRCATAPASRAARSSTVAEALAPPAGAGARHGRAARAPDRRRRSASPACRSASPRRRARCARRRRASASTRARVLAEVLGLDATAAGCADRGGCCEER